MIRILLVAPETLDLPSIVREVAAIVKLFDVRQVTGIVRESDIQAAMVDGPYDVIWWATHGGPDGVLITDSTLSPDAVGDYVRRSGADLCVLNTCASEEIAILIIAGGRASMIYTITEKVGDEDATRFAVLLSAAIAEMGDMVDYMAAFNIAAGPQPGKYRFLEAGQALRGFTLSATERMSAKVDDLQERYHELKTQVALLSVQMDQAARQSLLSQQASIQAHGTANQVAALDRNNAVRQELPPLFWAIIVLTTLLGMSTVFLLARGF